MPLRLVLLLRLAQVIREWQAILRVMGMYKLILMSSSVAALQPKRLYPFDDMQTPTGGRQPAFEQLLRSGSTFVGSIKARPLPAVATSCRGRRFSNV